MRAMRCFILSLLICMYLPAADVYFAQSATGGGAGTSCATAESVATFNAGTQVGDTTYHLCGTITVPVVPSTSGTSGHPWILMFDIPTIGNISIPAGSCPAGGIIQVGGLSYFTINGQSDELDDGNLVGIVRCMGNGTQAISISSITCSGGTATVTGPSAFGFTPGILATSPALVISGNTVGAYNTTISVLGNSSVQTGTTFTFTPSGGCAGTGTGGSIGALCPNGSYCTDQVQASGISGSANNFTVQGMKIYDIYLHTSVADTFSGQIPAGISAFGDNITVHDNIFKDFAWNILVGNNVTFYNNICRNFDHCIAAGITTAATTESGYYIFNNICDHAVTWDTGLVGSYHHDGFHLWAYVSGAYDATTYIQNVYIYNNRFTGNWGPINTTGAVFLEYNIKNVWGFNNTFDFSQNQADTGIWYGGINNHFWNNTLFGITATGCAANLTAYGYSSGLCNNGALAITGSTTLSQQNNVVTTGEILVEITATDEGGSNPTTISSLSNNIYMNGGALSGNPWNWKGTGETSLANWESASGETNAVYSASNTVVPVTLKLMPASPGIGAAVNLHSTCNGQAIPGLGALCSDINGNSRPVSAAWDSGAFNFIAGTQTAKGVNSSNGVGASGAVN